MSEMEPEFDDAELFDGEPDDIEQSRDGQQDDGEEL